ncbi:LRIG2 [Branchiostoma lanceolatum]|uniref:LRIG2 protein n=1 Tax=Branchiostoma lanceolatum TaxID=7740 RepID=A0A8J9ZL09_BRALA|nr:LRIG2 [Branchiostoma lanceolatum]
MGNIPRICPTLSAYGPFPAAQRVALRGVPVGNLSSQILGNIHPSSLTVLVITDASISTIEDNTFARFPHLRSVHLDYNTLSQLKRAYFSGWNTSYDSTAYLSLSYNCITELEPGCFENIPYLTRLDLSHNLLTEVASGWFRGLSFLHTLILSHNKIEVISTNALNSLYELRALNISHNPLTCLRERALSGLSLQTFSLGGKRNISWEQDDEIDWSLTVYKSSFRQRKEKVHLRIDSMFLDLTYATATEDFQFKSFQVKGQFDIQPPFVVALDLKRTEYSYFSASLLCSEAWTRHANTYSEIKDEDVYDPTRTHTYTEIKDEDSHGISVQVVRVENSTLNNSSQNISPNVVTTPRGTRQFIDVTALISNPMYTKSSAQPHDCTDPKERSTRRHSSTLSTHSYSEIKDVEVYDPSLTHMYSEIKDEEVGGLSAQDVMRGGENREQSNEEQSCNNEEQSSQCLEGNDVDDVDPDDEVVTFYAAAAEVALPPSTNKRDTQKQYGTGPKNTVSSCLYSAVKQTHTELEKKDE